MQRLYRKVYFTFFFWFKFFVRNSISKHKRRTSKLCVAYHAGCSFPLSLRCWSGHPLRLSCSWPTWRRPRSRLLSRHQPLLRTAYHCILSGYFSFFAQLYWSFIVAYTFRRSLGKIFWQQSEKRQVSEEWWQINVCVFCGCGFDGCFTQIVGCLSYNVADDGGCRRMSRRLQDLYAIKLPLKGSVKRGYFG
jgi:hypothetical protein